MEAWPATSPRSGPGWVGADVAGLDDTQRELRRFHEALSDFDERLRASVRDLSEIEVKMDQLWDDQFRRDFEQRRAEVAIPVKRYLEHDGARYLKFLQGRIRHLGRYMGDV